MKKGNYIPVDSLDPSFITACIMQAIRFEKKGYVSGYGVYISRGQSLEVVLFTEGDDPLGMIVTEVKSLRHRVFTDVAHDFVDAMESIVSA